MLHIEAGGIRCGIKTLKRTVFRTAASSDVIFWFGRVESTPERLERVRSNVYMHTFYVNTLQTSARSTKMHSGEKFLAP